MTDTVMFQVVDLKGIRSEKELDRKGMISYLDHLEKESGRNRDIHELSFDEVLHIYAEDYWMDVIRLS